MRAIRRSVFCVFVSAVAVSFASSPAVAQDEEGGATERLLPEVVVTAQKREQNIQDVPISVSTLSGDELAAINSAGADIRALSNRVPSLQIESSFGRTFPRFYIRGLGNTDFDLNSSQPVSLVYDEVVLENPIVKGFPMFDMDRVEVLRGPQGTLFGRNTPAGIVKFESVKPSQDQDGYARFSYGTDAQIDFEGAFGGALSDTTSARISVLYTERDDWVDNTFTGQSDALGGYDELAVRAQLLIEPSDDFSALLNVHSRNLNGTARLFRANIINPGTNDLVSGFTPDTGFDRDSISIDGENFQDLDAFGASAKLVWDLGTTTLTSVTGYESVELFSRGDIDGGFGASFLPSSGPGFIPFSAESADGIPNLDQFSQEFRLSSNDWDKGVWQAGFYYFTEDIDIESFSYDTLFGGVDCSQFGETFCDGYATQSQETDAWAIFASVDLAISDVWSVAGGLRYSDDQKDFVAQRFLPLGFNAAMFGTMPTGPIPRKTDDNVITWDISTTYAVNDHVNFYSRLAKGFRAPSIQGRVLFNNDIDGTDPAIDGVSVAKSEEIISIEAGFKTESVDGRMRFNINGFYFVVDDQQVTAVGGAININTLFNVDKTIGYGFEGDLQFVPNDNWSFSAGISYNNTEIDDPNLTVTPCGAPFILCTVLDPLVAGPGGSMLAAIDGNSLPQAPEWVISGTARYSAPMANGEFYVLLDGSYRSDIIFTLYESAEFSSDSLVNLGLRAGYVVNDGQYEFAVFGRNITDEVELVGGIDFNNLTGFVNAPRTWGVEVITRF
ncbi:MAG: TonB-dependent receptor [Proteobacteria bacterium]|nr:TonB-dependent receptor [Pseudomonadota bacterium]